MDISSALVAKSDQLNAVDLVGGPVVVSVVSATKGSDDRVHIVTDVFGPARPFKPSKTVLRILASAWGVETTNWIGRRMEIYREDSVRWAGEEVGGVRIKRLSHIDKPMTFNLQESKSKRAKSTIQPLPDVAPRPTPTPTTLPAEAVADWVASFDEASDITALQKLWAEAGKAGVASNPEVVAAKDRRKGELA